MDQPLAVGVRQSVQQRAQYAQRAVKRERSLAEQTGERLPLHERHGVVDQPLPFTHEMDREDVGVGQPGD